mmetsp:Transcript_13659/g.32422  ORF Transcript_13659/g.32422 Transcript_13659/m.32422 type:complete len:222 (-) Transcript_13659:228-893(-)
MVQTGSVQHSHSPMRRALLIHTAARFRKGFGSCGALPCRSRHDIGDDRVLLEPVKAAVPIPRAVLLAHGDRYKVAAFKAFAAKIAPLGRLRRVARHSSRDSEGPSPFAPMRVSDTIMALCVAATALKHARAIAKCDGAASLEAVHLKPCTAARCKPGAVLGLHRNRHKCAAAATRALGEAPSDRRTPCPQQRWHLPATLVLRVAAAPRIVPLSDATRTGAA